MKSAQTGRYITASGSGAGIALALGTLDIQEGSMKLYRIGFIVNGERLHWTRWADNLSDAWRGAERALCEEYCGDAELKAVEYVCDYKGA